MTSLLLFWLLDNSSFFPNSVDNCFVSCEVFVFLETTENKLAFVFGEMGGFAADALNPDFVVNASHCCSLSSSPIGVIAGWLMKAEADAEAGVIVTVDKSDVDDGETIAFDSFVGEYPKLLLLSFCLNPMTLLLGCCGIIRAVDGDEPANPLNDSDDESRS